MGGVRRRNGDHAEGGCEKGKRRVRTKHRNEEVVVEGGDPENKTGLMEGRNLQGKEAALRYWLQMTVLTHTGAGKVVGEEGVRAVE